MASFLIALEESTITTMLSTVFEAESRSVNWQMFVLPLWCFLVISLCSQITAIHLVKRVQTYIMKAGLWGSRTFGRDCYLSGLNGFPTLEAVFLQFGDMICPQSAFIITTHDVGLAWKEEFQTEFFSVIQTRSSGNTIYWSPASNWNTGLTLDWGQTLKQNRCN